MKKYLFVLLLGCFQGVFAQKQANFINFRVNSQNPFSRINCLAVDKNNVKWIGTEDYFASFAGDTSSTAADWRLYTRTNDFDTLIRQVSAIAIDHKQHKWLATYGKQITIVELDKKGDFVKHFPLPEKKGLEMYIHDIAIDRYGNKWLATEQSGIWVLDKDGKWENYNTENRSEEIRSNTIKAIEIDKNNVIWIGTSKGLCSVNDEGYWEFYDVRDEVTSIAVDKDYHVCLSLIDRKKKQHLYCNNEDFREAEMKTRKDKFYFQDLLIDETGVVWMAGNGVAKHEKGEQTLYNAENSNLKTELTTCLALDQDGNLWIGSKGDGLYKYILKEKKEVQEEITRPPLPQVLAKASPKMLKVNYTKIPLKKVPIPVIIIMEEIGELATLSTKKPFLLPIKKIKPSFKPKNIPIPKEVWDFIAANRSLMPEEDIVEGNTIELDDISFKSNSVELTNYEGVASLLNFMRMHPKVKIELSGHTDMDPPKDDPNYTKLSKSFMELSQKRVETVSNYLIKNGIDKSRIVTRAYGGTKPIENSRNSAINRRVEMKILEVN